MALPGLRAVLKLTCTLSIKLSERSLSSALPLGWGASVLLWGDFTGAVRLAGGLGRESVCFLPSVHPD